MKQNNITFLVEVHLKVILKVHLLLPSALKGPKRSIQTELK